MRYRSLIKQLTIFAAGIVMIALTACSSTTPPASPSVPAVTSPIAPTPTLTVSTLASPTVTLTPPPVTTPPTPPVLSTNPAPTITISPAPTNSASPATPPTSSITPGQQSVTVDLIAQNIAFNLKTITVPSSAAVTVNFNNKDNAVSHNFAVYQIMAGGKTKSVFVGQFITGPASTIYIFTSPPAGLTYFFECDNHPQSMNGQFVVTP